MLDEAALILGEFGQVAAQLECGVDRNNQVPRDVTLDTHAELLIEPACDLRPAPQGVRAVGRLAGAGKPPGPRRSPATSKQMLSRERLTRSATSLIVTSSSGSTRTT